MKNIDQLPKLKFNGHTLHVMPTPDEHRMHQHLRRARRHLSPETAPTLDPVSPGGYVSREVAEKCIDADYDDVKQQLRAFAENFHIAEGESAKSVAERLRVAIDEKLADLAWGRVKDVAVSVTPMKRDKKTGTLRNGHKIVVTSYHG